MVAYVGPVQLMDPEKTTEKSAPQIFTSLAWDSRVEQNLFPLNYACIRKLRKDPTVQLARWVVLAPMLHTPWVYVSENKKATTEMIDRVQQEIAPLRDFLLSQAVFGTLDYGWQPFETVFRAQDGMILFQNFKALLQDYTHIMVYLDTGQFAGFINEPLGMTNDSSQIIPIEHSLCTNFSVEGTDWYGYSVFTSLQSTLSSWDDVESTANRYDKKIAGASWIVYYPVGTTLYNGVSTANDEIARRILRNLEASGGAVIPDEIQEWLDPIERDAKGKWRIELITSDSSTQSSFIDRQKYLDSLKMRAFGLTERSVLEGNHGTKAESEVHGDVSLSIIHAKHKLICNQISTGPISQWLKWNYGDKYIDSITVHPAPLVDAQFALIKELYRLILQNPETLVQEVQKIDLVSMRKELGVPDTTTPQLIVPEKKEPSSGVRTES